MNKFHFMVSGVNPSLGRKREHRVLLMVIVMVVCYLLCWLPYGIMALLTTFGDPGLISAEASIVPSLLAKTSTVINPIIYIFMNKQPEYPHTVPADGAVGVEVEGHQAFWTCDSKLFILALTTLPPHTDSLVVLGDGDVVLRTIVAAVCEHVVLCGAAVCRMTHRGHHCSLNVCNGGCWVRQVQR
ncbi:hypothetical protein NFI96_014532 [Prochilodus magdalenae]|nr:hypothetical protein NFI96_014532 [Prochilodus magdalenae]